MMSSSGVSSGEDFIQQPKLFDRMLKLLRDSRSKLREQTWKFNYSTIRGQDDSNSGEDDGEDEFAILKSHRRSRQWPWRKFLAISSLVAASVGVLCLVSYVLGPSFSMVASQKSVSGQCQQLTLRREWRTLDDNEKAAYISAVKCLMKYPSANVAETSFYDDIVLAHAKTGSFSHYAAAFLPWHRLFLHVYERALQEKCEYNGAFPYWDWTLDYKDVAASPIWNTTHGFGGNGDKAQSEIFPRGRCVLEGPFSSGRRAWNGTSHGSSSHNVTFWPHCMTRGFASAEVDMKGLVEDLQYQISPLHVAETLDQPDYNSFFESFETGAHNAIPQFVNGEWLSLTAPNDPVFFLHHTQVDRMWWMWQQRDPGTRLLEFNGPAEDFLKGESAAQSSLGDVLPMAGLAQDKKVKDVMDTANELLCYRY